MGNVFVITPDKFGVSSIPYEGLPVTRKLSTLEDRRQDQSCLFRRRDYRSLGHKPESCP